MTCERMAGARHELERAVAFIAGMQDRMAERLVRFRFGTALFHDRLPHAWGLNFVRVDRDSVDLTADALAAEATILLSSAGLPHRKIDLNMEPVGRRLEPSFRGWGWKVKRRLVMAHRGEPATTSAAPRVVEVDADSLRPKWEQGIRSAEWARDEIVHQLLEAQLLRSRVVRVRYFAARAAGRLVSECSLFSDGTTAQVEAVHTLEEYRGRGFAQAVVARAVDEARGAGCALVFLLADDEDWPKNLYRKLGFEEIGRVWEFVKPPPLGPLTDSARGLHFDE